MYNNYDDGYGFDLVQMVKVNDDIYITCEMLFQHHTAAPKKGLEKSPLLLLVFSPSEIVGIIMFFCKE